MQRGGGIGNIKYSEPTGQRSENEDINYKLISQCRSASFFPSEKGSRPCYVEGA